MRHWILAALMVLIVGAAHTQELSRAFAEVPRGHWAYKAIEALIRARVIQRPISSTCVSARPPDTMTRYELAMLTDRASRHVAYLKTSAKPDDRRKVSPAVLQALAKLRKEFAAEIRKLPKSPSNPRKNRPGT